MYDELLEKEIIPDINRENSDELSTRRLANVVEKLDETIQTYTQKIENSEDTEERKRLRSKRKHRNNTVNNLRIF